MKDRSPRKLTRREALLALTALAGGALACAYADVPIVTITPPRTPVPSPTLPFRLDNLTAEVKVTPIPSGTPAATQTETATMVPPPTIEKPKPPEVMMPYIGNTYLGDPFQIELPEETARLAAFWEGVKTFSIDDPLLVLQNELTEDEYDTMNPHNIIKTPKVGLIFQTDNRRENSDEDLKHLIIYGHSGYSLLGEELPFNFFKKLINMNPESIIGAKISLLQNQLRTNLEIVHYTTVTEEKFNLAFFNYKNSDEQSWQSVPVFISLNSLGIDINTPPFNGTDDLITFVACYGPDGDLTSGRMLITAKLLP